jgi:nucleotide-binding universal stress UspA family protein
MYSKILVPLDGSERSERVLPPARSIVEALKVDVELLQVIDPNVVTAFSDPEHGCYADQVGSSIRNNSINYLETIANSFPDPSKVTCSAELGNAAEVIADKAAAHPGTIIAMSTHGRSVVQRWFLGSTADKVMHAANSPLLLVRATDDTPLGQATLLKKIVVPLDGSRLAELTLPHVVELTKNLGLEVVLVRVFDPLSQGRMPYVDHIGEKMREEAKAYLELKVRGLKSEGLKDVSYLLLQGNTAAKIVDITLATHDNLVAICTHCRSGIGRWVLGSVTDRVVRHSGNPVLVIRASH